MPEALVLVRFPVAQAAQCKADCSATVGNFGGKFIGAGGKMEVVEGEFPHGDSTIAMLSFESLDKAKSWVGGAEKVMNTDWLGTADIISVPVKNPPGPGKPCVQMIDVKVIDEARFAKEYAPGHAPALKAAGAFPEVVCSGDITCLRGQAKPNFIVLHAWASSATFRTFYDGAENQKWKTLRQELSKGVILLFTLQ